MTLPMQLHTEQLSDHTSNYSILYGPIVLAASLGTDGQTGLFADDSRGGHIAEGPKLPLQDMPVIVGKPDKINSYMTRDSDCPMSFTLTHIAPSVYGDMTLVPFASLNECRYIVYWPVISPEELTGRQQQIAVRQAEREQLDAMTVDMVICGEQQPESDHFISMDRTYTGNDQDVHWRRADCDGWFSYKFSCTDRHPDTLRVYYRQSDNSSATVWIDSTEVGKLTHGVSNGVTYADFPISDTLKSPSIVKIAAPDSEKSPIIYEIRLMTVPRN